MARDIGLSSILIFGVLYAVFSSIRVIRREIESGTLQMALAHPVSREAFFLSKVLGVWVACGIFFMTLLGATLTTATGAHAAPWAVELQARLAEGDECCNHHVLPGTIWVVSVAIDVATIILPMILAAMLNRFASFRFSLSATVLAFISAVAGFAVNLALAYSVFGQKADELVSLAVRLVPAGLVLLPLIAFFASAAMALSVKYKDNVVAVASLILFALVLPILGNYYLSHALARGGSIPPSYVCMAFLAMAPLVGAFLVTGTAFLKGRDVG